MGNTLSSYELTGSQGEGLSSEKSSVSTKAEVHGGELRSLRSLLEVDCSVLEVLSGAVHLRS